MSRHYDHVLSFAIEHPWAVTRPMLQVVAGILARRLAGEDVDQAEIAAALVNRKNLPQPRAGSVAIIPMYGVIAPRMNLFSEMSGGTTFEKLTAQLREAVGTKAVKTIVFDVDSPGGNVAGATEFAREVMKARTKKAIVAQIQYTGASAAYWAIAGATEIVAAPSAKVGSIGVYAAHNDLSEALAKLGVKRTYLAAGEGKVDGNEAEPLSDTARARLETLVTEAYDRMVGDIVKGRGQGVTADRVRKDWKAHTYGSAEALSLGLVDQVATLDDTLARILGAGDAEDQRAAQALLNPPEATPQEPERVTGQEPTSDATWQNRAIAELLALDL